LASSFYSDRDEPIASVLTRTLMETNQEIPDFLQSYVPEGATADNLKFEADSDFEEEAVGTGGGGWGAGGDDAGDVGNNDAGAGGGGWGTGGDDTGANGNDTGGWGAGGNSGGGGWCHNHTVEPATGAGW
jgi:ATP-dependent RNA helicase DDX3X